MFSQTTEYALRVIAYVASLDGAPATTRQISAATQVPEGYLAKVVRSLNREGLLNSQRGLHGGSVLARPPEQITVFDVIQAIAPLPRITTCPLGIKGHGPRLCPLHRKLDDAVALVERAFRTSTIADILSQDTGSKPMCDADADAGKPAAVAPGRSKSIALPVTRRR